MTSLARYILNPVEKKNYTLKYSAWLDTGESLASVVVTVSPTATPPLQIAGAVDAVANEVLLTVGPGGVDGETYEVEITVTTDVGQVKHDCIGFDIQDSC